MAGIAGTNPGASQKLAKLQRILPEPYAKFEAKYKQKAGLTTASTAQTGSEAKPEAAPIGLAGGQPEQRRAPLAAGVVGSSGQKLGA